MKIFCDGLDLADAVLAVSKAIGVKTTNPILEGIKLTAEENTLTISATDLELFIEKKIRAEVRAEGETIVPGKFLVDYVRKLSGEKVELNLIDKNKLTIKYLENEGFIQCYNSAEYPVFKRGEEEGYFGITQKNLKEMINKTVFSVALDDSRPILKGVLFEVDDKIAAVALDGYRMAVAEKPIFENRTKKRVIIPAKSLNELAKLLEDNDNLVNIYISRNEMLVDLEKTKISTRLLEGEFLNYKQIIPSSFEKTVTVSKKAFEEALERASILSRVGQNNLVKFEIKEKHMLISSNSEIGNLIEKVAINHSGGDLKIAFNARYFIEALRTISSDFIQMDFNASTNPCVVRSVDEKEKAIYLILPVRMMN